MQGRKYVYVSVCVCVAAEEGGYLANSQMWKFIWLKLADLGFPLVRLADIRQAIVFNQLPLWMPSPKPQKKTAKLIKSGSSAAAKDISMVLALAALPELDLFST